MTKVLFILKYREDRWGSYSGGYPSSGLLNSATFVRDMLSASGVESKLVQVVDNNCIDREVTLYRPTHVIVEAYWVVPEKLELLSRLHPNVTWIVRNHSEVPFLSTEGIAIDWTRKCAAIPRVFISCNSKRAEGEFATFVPKAKLVYLPNFYPVSYSLAKLVRETFIPKKVKVLGESLHVGCFGAIRPLKNQLCQAIASIAVAKAIGKKLTFHINGTRIESDGNNGLKNIRALFNDNHEAELVEHRWMSHKDFSDFIRHMDIGLQVSFTETFNIVAADFVGQGVPIVVSPEVRWMPDYFKADPTSFNDIRETMLKVLRGYSPEAAKAGLKAASDEARKVWLKSLKSLHRD